MPKRKVLKTSEATLDALRQAHREGRTLTSEEEVTFAAFRSRAHIKVGDGKTLVTTRRGQDVFRTKGKAGADLEEHPVTARLAKLERDHLTDEVKRTRRPPLDKAISARQQRAQVLADKVLERLEALSDLGDRAAAAVANELGISDRHVRRIRDAARRT